MSSFGGPIAHLGYFRLEFVERRKWLSDSAYADLVALCQFLPGPASTQVVFALGLLRAGILGALTASLCFLLPSAVAMIAFGYGIGAFRNFGTAGWVHGLKLAAVPVVAQAVLAMWKSLCPDKARTIIGVAAGVVMLFLPGAPAQFFVISAGAIAGWTHFRHSVKHS